MQLPRQWLVVRLSALGDIALTTGVLDRWNRLHGWRFTFLVFSQWASVLEGHPAIDRIVGVSRDDVRAASMLRLFRSLSSDLAGYGLIDLHGSLRSRLLRLVWPGPVFHYPKYSMERRLFLRSGGRLCREKLLQYNVPQRYALSLDEVAPERGEVLPRIFLSEAEREDATAILQSRGIAEGKGLVALHPYSTHANKAWRPENWLALTRMLLAEGYRVLVVGRGERIFGEMPEVHDLTGVTTLRQTCALLERCSVVVTGDSGPMHLACGVGTPVVALFGPTHGVWGFYPEGAHDVVLEADEDCRPCSLHGSRPCGREHICMTSLTPGMAFDAVQRVASVRISSLPSPL